MRDWIELVAILAILVVDILLLVDSRAMVRLYTDYYAERRQARKAAAQRWRAKGRGDAILAGYTGADTVSTGMVADVDAWTNEGGATGQRI